MSTPMSPNGTTNMSMEEKLRYLNEQLQQRDDTLNTMKIKTKEYVTKLKSDAAQEKEQLRQEYEAKFQSLSKDVTPSEEVSEICPNLCITMLDTFI